MKRLIHTCSRCVFSTLVILLSGCVTSQPKPDSASQRLDDPSPKYVKAVDRLAEIYEKYGAVTFATPFLVAPDPKENYFAFNLPEHNAPEYFSSAKNDFQGRAGAALTDISLGKTGLALRGDLDTYLLQSNLRSQYDFELSRYYRNLALSDQRQRTIDGMQYKVARAKLDLALTEAERANKDDPVAREKAVVAAWEQYLKDVPQAPEVGEAPKYPEAPDPSKLPSVDKELSKMPDTAKDRFGDLDLAARLALIGGDQGKVAVRQRSALITAAGDTIVEGMLRVLGEADQAVKFENKKVLYGVSMVSIQPGSITREGFDASLIVQPKLYYEKATKPSGESMKDGVGAQDGHVAPKVGHQTGGESSIKEDPCRGWIEPKAIPAVAAVSPLGDVQNLDLSSSQRTALERAKDVAVSLRFSGIEVGIGNFDDYVKKLEEDIRTGTPAATVSTFAMPGAFGYRFAPTLVAMAEPSSGAGKPRMQLQQQSFPVLVLIGLDTTDLVGKAHPMDSTVMCEPTLGFTQTVKWIPRDDSARASRLSEQELVEIHKELNGALTQRQQNAAKDVGEANRRAYETRLDAAATSTLFLNAVSVATTHVRKVKAASEELRSAVNLSGETADKAADEAVKAAVAAVTAALAATVDTADRAAVAEAMSAAAKADPKADPKAVAEAFAKVAAAKAAAESAGKAVAEAVVKVAAESDGKAIAESAKAAAAEAGHSYELATSHLKRMNDKYTVAGKAQAEAELAAKSAVEAASGATVSMLNARAESLSRLVYGSGDTQSIPTELKSSKAPAEVKIAKIKSVVGGPIRLEPDGKGGLKSSEVELVFLGQDLDLLKLPTTPAEAAIVGSLFEVQITDQRSEYAKVKLKVDPKGGQKIVLRFTQAVGGGKTGGGEIVIPGMPVDVQLPESAKSEKKPADGVTLKQTTASGATSNVIEFQGELSDQKMDAAKQLLKAQVEKDKPAAPVVVPPETGKKN